MTQPAPVNAPANAPVYPTRSPAPSPGLVNTMRSEWTKLRSLRSTPVTLIVTALLVVGLSALITWAAYGAPTHGKRVLTNPVGIIQVGWFFGLLAIAILGVMVISNEYSSGMIVSTFLATPKRARVLLAKVVVFGVVMTIVGEVMSFVNFFVGQAIISGFPRYYDPSLSDKNVLRAVVGMGLDAALAGLMGLALGTLLRHAAGAIAVAVGIVFVEPIVAAFLPSSVQNPLNEYWPTQAGSQLEEVSRQSHALTAWWGTGDLVLFIIVLLLAAGLALLKRDA